MADILMPKATAIWLVDNTGLSFEQIAEFCTLHRLEVKGIADGDVGENMRGVDPIAGGVLTREEIERCEADPSQHLVPLESKIADVPRAKRKGGRYTPVTLRQSKPDAIAWILRNHPEVADRAIEKLIGTTKATIGKVRDKTHHRSGELEPVDPVSAGLCSQVELDAVIEAAAARRAKLEEERAADDDGPGLAPATDAAPAAADAGSGEEEESKKGTPNAEDVFSNFKL